MTAETETQREIAGWHASSSRVAVYDYSAPSSGSYDYGALKSWLDEHERARVIFILNFQNALSKETDSIDEETHSVATKQFNQLLVANFNLHRDVLAGCHKVWIFCMTRDLYRRLMGYAPDFYSYVRLHLNFADKTAKPDTDSPIPDMEEYQYFATKKEAAAQLQRYRDSEARLLAILDERLPRPEEVNRQLAVANSLDTIARLYAKYNEYKRALELHKKVLAVREELLEKEHPDIAASYSNIAWVHFCQADYRRAQTFYEKSLDIRERRLGARNLDTVITYQRLGWTHYRLHEYKKAFHYLRMYLSRCKEIFSKDEKNKHNPNQHVAKAYSALSRYYYQKGDYHRAMTLIKAALNMRQAVFGEENPETAMSYNHIADIYARQGEYYKAIEFNGKALAIRQKIFGEEHLDTARSYFSLAEVYYQQGDYEQAREYYEKSLEINKKFLADTHVSIAAIYARLGEIENMRGGGGGGGGEGKTTRGGGKKNPGVLGGAPR
ncbi:MAG: tetratricopeptide repeat protein [Desulfobulbaceae bacterium]|nr:tetratricopeptide repeat protein [Desulfobulbaceae bacterium]